ncbi:hypothetical protein ACJX0J_033767, partial [Zea mays]
LISDHFTEEHRILKTRKGHHLLQIISIMRPKMGVVFSQSFLKGWLLLTIFHFCIGKILVLFVEPTYCNILDGQGSTKVFLSLLQNSTGLGSLYFFLELYHSIMLGKIILLSGFYF